MGGVLQTGGAHTLITVAELIVVNIELIDYNKTFSSMEQWQEYQRMKLPDQQWMPPAAAPYAPELGKVFIFNCNACLVRYVQQLGSRMRLCIWVIVASLRRDFTGVDVPTESIGASPVIPWAVLLAGHPATHVHDWAERMQA